MKMLVGCTDPMFRGFVAAAARDCGYEVVTVDDVDQLKMHLGSGCYHSAVINFLYPTFNASDLLSSLCRSKGWSSRRPTIYVLSWLHHEKHVIDLYEMGIDEFHTLPVNIERLKQSFRRRRGLAGVGERS